MNGFAVIFVLVNAIELFSLPRRWAPLPLLVGTCYMTLGQGIEVASFHFPVIRILVAVGLVRVFVRAERLPGRMNGLDRLMVLWSVWALASSSFHKDALAVLENRMGLVYNACGIYFLLRVFCRSLDDVLTLCRITAMLLVPLSLLILVEKMTGHNLFSLLGGVSQFSEVRMGSIRAQGPFAHPILAGTVGAVCLPLMAGLWKQRRKTAMAGIGACVLMILSSASSGPILSAGCAVGALFLWRWRHRMRLLRWLAVLAYAGLDLVMNAPAYFIIARINLTGGSTGWHRAALIEAAVAHLPEWWLAGTDYTRHWMPYGVSWSGDHIDITNYYLNMGVWGGLPLMILFIAIIVKGFSLVGRMLQQMRDASRESRFMLWALGSSLFAHTATFLSVSYFDQTVMFIYLTLAVIGSGSAVAFRPAGDYAGGPSAPERFDTAGGALPGRTG